MGNNESIQVHKKGLLDFSLHNTKTKPVDTNIMLKHADNNNKGGEQKSKK